MLKRLLMGLTLLVLVFVSATARAHADVNDFVINDMTADFYLTRDDPQGSMQVKEEIDLTFSDFNHGILRAVPMNYKGRSVQLKVTSVSSSTGAPATFTTYTQNGNKVIKIGDPNRTVTGHQAYSINYTLTNVVTFYGDHDELYWDINGEQWAQPFTKIRANFHLPDDIKSDGQLCFTGGYGATEKACTISADKAGVISVTTTRTLQPYENVSLVMSLPTGYFKPMTRADRIKEFIPAIIAFLAMPLTVGGAAFIYWLLRGRDDKGLGVVIPEYEPPKDMGPLEIGTLADFKADNRDITAVVIDLAVKRYITINEIERQGFLGIGGGKTYSFTLNKAPTEFKNVSKYELAVLDGFFANMVTVGLAGQQAAQTPGLTVTLDSLKYVFSRVARNLRKDVQQDLTNDGYYKSNPLKSAAFLGALSTLSFIAVIFFAQTSFFTHSVEESVRPFMIAGLVGGFLLTSLLMKLFIWIIPARTEKGSITKEKIEGLKLYMNTAEKDRLAMLQSPDSPYVNKSPEPTRTVELYEKLLPYAVALGVEGEWSKQFEDIYKTPPEWYQGNWTAFNMGYFASSLSNGVATMGTTFSPPSSSGSSGFSSGGGFSGGGGGGGGGGGW